MRRIAFATDGVFPAAQGGMARHSQFLVGHLARLGVSVDVFHPGPVGCFDQPQIKEIPVKWPHYSFPGHYIVESWNYSRALFQALARSEESYDVAYVQGLSLWGSLRKIPFPIIVNPHGLEFFQYSGLLEWFKSWPVRRAFRAIFNDADAVISLGGRLTGMLVSKGRLHPSRVVVIPNGVDLDFVDSLTREENEGSDPCVRFLFVGRLAFNKGLPELVAAFNALDRDDVELVIVGDGEMKKRLQRMTDGLSVSLIGSVDDEELFRRLVAATCFIFPSRGEGMPTAILEAMACRLPVVATDVGAVSELVDETNGALIPPGDQRALGHAIGWMADLDSGTRRVLGDASRRRVEESFTWPRIAAKTLAILEEMVEAGPTARP